MKHSRHIAYFLVLTLIVSVAAGAMSVCSVYASYDSGYITVDYIKEQISGCNVASSLQTKVDNVYNNIESWCSSDRYFLTYIEKYDDPSSFYISVFRPFTNQDYFYLSVSDAHYGEVTTTYSYVYLDAILYVYDGSVVACTTTSYYSNDYDWLPDNVINWDSHSFGYYQVTAFGPDQNNNDKVYISMDLYYGSSRESLGWSENILLEAPVFPFYLKAFTLGERKYITITDQTLIRDLDPDKEDYILYLFNNEDEDDEIFDFRNIYWDDITLIPGGENFVSGLTNVSPLGVYAYDITDLWWTEIQVAYLQYEHSIYGVAMNTPYDFNAAAPDPGTEGTPSSETQIYEQIYNYTVNYPTITVVPQQLAQQLTGGRALSSGLGYVQVPNQISQWLGELAEDEPGTEDQYFRYDLQRSGYQPEELSMINFDLLSVCIVPARGQLYDRFNMQYWDYTLEYDTSTYTISSDRIAKVAYTNDLFEMYDLVIFAATDADWLGDTYVPHNVSEDGIFGYTGDLERVQNLTSGEPVYWILTRSALQKSQLYVMCDGISKVYDLFSQFVLKRDLLDSSIFNWTMSTFYQLQTIGGYLSGIKSMMESWGLNANYFLTLSEKLDNIVTNTRLDDPGYWYLPLWNFIQQFKPSIEQFADAVDVWDESWDDVPLLPQPSQPPALPTLPGFEIEVSE